METEDFLESPKKTRIKDTDSMNAGEEDKKNWAESANLEIQLPVEDLAEDKAPQDYVDAAEDEPAPEDAPEGGDSEVESYNLEEAAPQEEEKVIADEPSPDPEVQISETAEVLHPEEFEEASSFARLLVSEIKLYNEAEVKEGRKNGDLYSRLKEQIDLSREVYENRIPDEVRAEKDYFGEELLRILAKGNAEILNSK